MERLIFALVALGFCAVCASAPGTWAEREKVRALPESKIYDWREPLLDVYFRKPAGPGPFPALIFLHGCAGIEWEFADPTAEKYLEIGYAVAVLDSLEPRGLLNVCDPRLPFNRNATPTQRAWDAYAALGYLARRPDIDATRIYLHGESHGGDAVIAALEVDVARDNRLQFAGGIAYYPYCGNLLRPTRPLLILAGAKDDWTPASSCRETVDHMRGTHAPVRVVVYPNAYHAFNHRMRDVIYQGHALGYDPEAAADSLAKIVEFMRAPPPQPAR